MLNRAMQMDTHIICCQHAPPIGRYLPWRTQAKWTRRRAATFDAGSARGMDSSSWHDGQNLHEHRGRRAAVHKGCSAALDRQSRRTAAIHNLAAPNIDL